jgi:toxin ParE1/3/4
VAQVIWSIEARADLLAVYEYISHDNPTVAERLILELASSADRLVDFPMSGREVPELAHKGVREVVAPPYVIAYRVSGEIVEILKVRHGRQLLRPSEILRDE